MGTKKRNEMWISNNRVLAGNNKKLTGRNPNFDAEETKVLISLWGDPQIQRTLITTHKKHVVIAKLAEKMRDYGYYRSPEEINTRIKNLKCFYNRIKKDMEIGVSTVPTWKHYSDMDEIMTRPIFSVRPNEIPKPSLRYRLEEEKKEREEKEKEKKRVAAEIKKLKKKKIESENDSNEDDDNDDDDDVDDDDEMDDAFDDVSFTQELYEDEITAQEEQEKKLKQEQEEANSSDVEETPLIIPKEEPIDVDEESMDIDRHRDNSNDGFPKLPPCLQKSPGISGTSNENKIITTMAGTSRNNELTPTNTIKISQQSLVNTPTITKVFANQQTPISSQQGKISLVPTNFLLKPQPQQAIQIRPQPQHRIIYTKPAVQSSPTGLVATGTATTATAAAAAGQQVPMKVFLVNTLQKSTPNAAAVPVTTIDSQIKAATNVAALQQNNVSHKTNNSHTSSHIPEKRQKISSTSSSSSIKTSKDQPGIRALLAQLIRLQSDNLEVNKQRLDVEKQRFSFEKNIAEKFLDAFISQQNTQQTSSQSHSINSSGSNATNSIENSQLKTSEINGMVPLLIPKPEKVDDGYEK